MTRDPIHDEVVRDELDELGQRHFLDVRATVRSLLDGMPGRQRAAFAVAVAERLLAEHEGLPVTEQVPEVLQWRPALDSVWHCLRRDEPTGRRQVAEVVGAFYLSPIYLDRRHDNPGDRNDHATMAAFYAAACYLHGCLEFATWAGWRGFDVATLRAAGDQDWVHRRPVNTSSLAWELAHPAIQAELDRQLVDVELLGEQGWVLVEDGEDRDGLIASLRRHGYALP